MIYKRIERYLIIAIQENKNDRSCLESSCHWEKNSILWIYLENNWQKFPSCCRTQFINIITFKNYFYPQLLFYYQIRSHNQCILIMWYFDVSTLLNKTAINKNNGSTVFFTGYEPCLLKLLFVFLGEMVPRVFWWFLYEFFSLFSRKFQSKQEQFYLVNACLVSICISMSFYLLSWKKKHCRYVFVTWYAQVNQWANFFLNTIYGFSVFLQSCIEKP